MSSQSYLEDEITRLQTKVDELQESEAALKTIIKKSLDLSYEAPELNMDNYTHEEIEELNDAMHKIFFTLVRGKRDEYIESRK